MIKVRCPRCDTFAEEPDEAFPCAECGARLRWHQPSAFTSQLALDIGGWQQPELPVIHASNPRLPTDVVLPQPDEHPPLAMEPTDAARIAISLITSAMAAGDGVDDVRTASLDVLYGLSPQQLILLCMTWSQLTATIFKDLDARGDGLGTGYLQAWALAFMQDRPPES